MQFRIETMVCGGCLRGVARAVQSVDPGAEVTADIEGRTVRITSGHAAGDFAAALEAAGFPAVPVAEAAPLTEQEGA